MRKTGKIIQAIGKAGEDRARWFFNQIGAKCVEKISTPMISIKGKAIYCATSSVDFTAAFPSPNEPKLFIPCRIEVKVCDGDKLLHSRLSELQVKWLTDWYNCGFYSWVLWINKMDCYLIPYPNPFFKAGKSLSIEDAQVYKK